MTKRSTHTDSAGRARMVNVSAKRPTARTAEAEAVVHVGRALAKRLAGRGGLEKGSVLETARIAGIQAAKRAAELIPMCHPLPLDAIAVDAELGDDHVRLTSHVACTGKTGVEMEALTAAAVAALTVYDMVKSAGKGIEIGPIRLLSKTGGKSGNWKRKRPT